MLEKEGWRRADKWWEAEQNRLAEREMGANHIGTLVNQVSNLYTFFHGFCICDDFDLVSFTVIYFVAHTTVFHNEFIHFLVTQSTMLLGCRALD